MIDGHTYSLGDRCVVLQAGNDENIIVIRTKLDNLSSSNIGESSVVEEGRSERGSLCDVLRGKLTDKDVIVEQSLNEAFLRCLRSAGAVQGFKSLVRRSQKGDILCFRKCLCDFRVAFQHADQARQVLISAQDRGEVSCAGVFLCPCGGNRQCGSQELFELHVV